MIQARFGASLSSVMSHSSLPDLGEKGTSSKREIYVTFLKGNVCPAFR